LNDEYSNRIDELEDEIDFKNIEEDFD